MLVFLPLLLLTQSHIKICIAVKKITPNLNSVNSPFLFKISTVEEGEMVKWLRALAVLSEDLGATNLAV